MAQLQSTQVTGSLRVNGTTTLNGDTTANNKVSVSNTNILQIGNHTIQQQSDGTLLIL